MDVLEQIRGQMDAVNLPLYAITLTAVPCPDTPVLLMLHWHGFRRDFLIDAPQDAARWLDEKGFKVSLLLLTHGHIDHVLDAAKIQRTHGCRVGYHSDGVRMLTEPGFFRKLGFE